jgi:hypothetical protein
MRTERHNSGAAPDGGEENVDGGHVSRIHVNKFNVSVSNELTLTPKGVRK